jgi:hypothetical protein
VQSYHWLSWTGRAHWLAAAASRRRALRSTSWRRRGTPPPPAPRRIWARRGSARTSQGTPPRQLFASPSPADLKNQRIVSERGRKILNVVFLLCFLEFQTPRRKWGGGYKQKRIGALTDWRDTPSPQPSIHRVHSTVHRGRILGHNWDKSFKSFPPCYHL